MSKRGQCWTVNEIQKLKDNSEMPTEKIVNILGRSKSAIHTKASRLNIKLKYKHHYPFNPTPNPNLSYVLGTILSDGTIKKPCSRRTSRTIKLTAKDFPFVEKFADSLGIIKGKHNSVFPENKYWSICCSWTSFGKWLESSTLDDIMKIVNTYPCEFIQGFADGDGHIHVIKQHNRRTWSTVIEIINTNFELLSMIKVLLNNLGITPTIRIGRKGTERWNSKYVLTIRRRHDIIQFYNLIGFSIPRKQNTLEKGVKIITGGDPFEFTSIGSKYIGDT